MGRRSLQMDEKNEMKQKIRSLELQVAQLLSSLNTTERDVHIEIHQLTVEDFSLEDLSFRLDTLDIKDLSGTLNLGNNFAGGVQRNKKHASVSKTDDKTVVLINGKKIPFQWHNVD